MKEHAFAVGTTFAAMLPSNISARLVRAGRRWMKRQVDLAVQDQVSASFAAGAECGTGVRLGAAAWCANRGVKANITLGSETVCRGMLRTETPDAKLSIGCRVYIGDGVIICAHRSVVIEDDVLIAHGVQILDNNSHPTAMQDRLEDWRRLRAGLPRDVEAIRAKEVVIRRGAWIGSNAIITRGVEIGEGAVVGAGSVVTKDVPAHSVVAGPPASVITGPGEQRSANRG